jgi:flavin reductase (DIM6/NTAB) family NADH-FMN oxidoreductase RutF
MELDPRSLERMDLYKLVIGCVVPRPIAVVSTASPNGKTNLAPFSYFTVASHTPLSLLVNIAGQKSSGDEKDTLRNARPVAQGGTGEFVVNVAVEAYAKQMAMAAAPNAYEESEFSSAGLTPAPSLQVKPPRVAESPVAFECRTTHVIAIGASNLVIGEVVHIYLQDGVMNERYHVDPDKLRAVGRMAGNDYCRTTDRFELPDARGPRRVG